MDEDLKTHLQKFVEICYGRLEKGAETHGKNYDDLDLHEEMIQELADIANYAFMEYVKVLNLKDKKDRILKENTKE